jgi:hypothetical protein
MSKVKRLGWDYDPTKPAVKVLLADYNKPDDKIFVLMNPESIEFSISVGIGKPQPVGWSNPIKQYSHTGEVVSGLELRINESVLGRSMLNGESTGDIPSSVAHGMKSILDYVSWISAFCYSTEAGIAPNPLYLHWPYVTTMVFVIESMKTRFTRFNRKLQPVDGTISLGISELRFAYCDSLQQKLNGFLGRVDYSNANTGHSLNPGSK